MTIPSQITTLLQSGANRNIRIHFPNGERPDICNDKIGSEELSIEQSICSQDKFQFGLCESSVFETEVHNIEEKRIPTKTATGADVHITDGVANPVIDLGIEGKSEQQTYSGKNLLKNNATSKTVNGVTYTVNEDKSVTVSGTSTAATIFMIGQVMGVNGKKYSFTGKSGDANMYCYGWNGGTTWQFADSVINCVANNNLMVGIYIDSGRTLNNIVYPMLCESEVIDEDYEPYVDEAISYIRRIYQKCLDDGNFLIEVERKDETVNV